MDPWYGKWGAFAVCLALVAIRAPYGHRSRAVPVAESRRGALETALLTLAWIAFVLPFLWTATRWFSFAEIPLRPAAWGAGVLLAAAGLLLFHRSHADLGRNWSITLEVREGHRLVTAGVYRRIRHPMYASLLLHGAGLALVVPNLVAGPSYLAVMLLITACRLGPEERMMEERFGEEYRAYRAGTKRLVPGVF